MKPFLSASKVCTNTNKLALPKYDLNAVFMAFPWIHVFEVNNAIVWIFEYSISKQILQMWTQHWYVVWWFHYLACLKWIFLWCLWATFTLKSWPFCLGRSIHHGYWCRQWTHHQCQLLLQYMKELKLDCLYTNWVDGHLQYALFVISCAPELLAVTKVCPAPWHHPCSPSSILL